MSGGVTYVNQHAPYRDLPKSDRRALRHLLRAAFPIGKSSHKLWSDFPDTTAFVRRQVEPSESGPPEGIVGGAIVMSYPAEQYDYLAYLAVLPQHRRRGGLLRRSGRPHHGTHLMHDIYDVMRNRVTAERPQRYLMIEPAGEEALRFYLRALPTNEYPLHFHEEERIITLPYDGLAL